MIGTEGAAVYTDLTSLASLKSAVAQRSPQALREAAGQFEALFMQMLLKNMRDTTFGGGIFDSDQTRFYQEIFDKQLATTLSQRNGLGLADMLIRQLAPEASSADTAEPVSRSPELASGMTDTPAFDTPGEFVSTLSPHARAAAAELGTAPEVLLAQAALETGWGRAMITDGQGTNSHNLFGIKAGADWSGPRVYSTTLEYEGGIAVRRREAFRAYPSYADSFADYVSLIKGQPRYGEALSNAGDAAAYTRALQAAGYATDPDYSNKIMRIMEEAGSLGARGPFKNTAATPLTSSDVG